MNLWLNVFAILFIWQLNILANAYQEILILLLKNATTGYLIVQSAK